MVLLNASIEGIKSNKRFIDYELLHLGRLLHCALADYGPVLGRLAAVWPGSEHLTVS